MKPKGLQDNSARNSDYQRIEISAQSYPFKSTRHQPEIQINGKQFAFSANEKTDRINEQQMDPEMEDYYTNIAINKKAA